MSDVHAQLDGVCAEVASFHVLFLNILFVSVFFALYSGVDI